MYIKWFSASITGYSIWLLFYGDFETLIVKVELAGVEPLAKNYNRVASILIAIGAVHVFVCLFGSIVIAKEKFSLLIIV